MDLQTAVQKGINVFEVQPGKGESYSVFTYRLPNESFESYQVRHNKNIQFVKRLKKEPVENANLQRV